MKPYDKSKIPFAKELRKNQTPWERKLWYEFLRNYPVKFRRQATIGNYIVDFYCPKARLIIELDGGGHYNKKEFERDKKRTERLNEYEVTVIRFSNYEVDKYFYEVCETINKIVNERLP